MSNVAVVSNYYITYNGGKRADIGAFSNRRLLTIKSVEHHDFLSEGVYEVGLAGVLWAHHTQDR